jgi:hypothetical protein
MSVDATSFVARVVIGLPLAPSMSAPFASVTLKELWAFRQAGARVLMRS